MVLELKIRKIGNSVGVLLPKEALSRLNVAEGDTVVLTDAADSGILMRSNQIEFAAKMALVDALCKRYRNTLHELAK